MNAQAAKIVPTEENLQFDAEFHSQVCAGCSCLCDDISYYIRDGKLERSLNLCQAAMKRLLSLKAGKRLPPLGSDELNNAVSKTAALLKENGPPLVLGADGLDEEGIFASMRLAGALGGVWLPRAFFGVRRFFQCAARVGWSTALLDEVRDNAESVIFWRADPLKTHYRLLSRGALYCRGRYVSRGHNMRNLAVVAGGEDTPIEKACQQFFRLRPEEDEAFLKALFDPPRALAPDHPDFPLLRNALGRSSYIAVFVDTEDMTDAAVKALFDWSAAVNELGRQRLVILPLFAGGCNIAGFVQASLEKNSTAWGADFSGGAVELFRVNGWRSLAAGVGSVLYVEPGPKGKRGLRRSLPQALEGKPTAYIDPFKQTPEGSVEAVIPTALSGVETDGVFFRMDGIPLEVRGRIALEDSGYPTAADVFDRILKEVEA